MKKKTFLNNRFVPVLFAVCVAAGLSGVACSAEFSPANPVVWDMVHHNPGEARYDSIYEDPAELKKMGYTGKVYFLFDSPTLAVDWESVDPEIFPKGSDGRKWVDETAARIDGQMAACKKAGIEVYAMADLILFPKALVEKQGMQNTMGDPRNEQTEKFLRLLISQMFERFPDMEGLVVRIGETYLHDAPFHQGQIHDKGHADRTIIPLANLLRDEICVKRNKQLLFRTWMVFDTDLGKYLRVSDAVEPHPNLAFSIKHVEGDFHRANRFARLLGEGRHPQVVEVQCAREYEGKGAYPNYIGKGVIEGFEEHVVNPTGDKFSSVGAFARTSPLWAGMWTWTRGGGWNGPYIKDELWCDLNAWVLAQWAHDVSQSEEKIFYRYAKERLGLGTATDIKKFRRLALLSADAVVRGRNSTHGDMNPWWTRDQGISWPENPKDKEARERNLAQKDESVERWKEIVKLAESIQWPGDAIRDHAVGSACYGLHLYEIYRSIVYLSAAEAEKDEAAMKKWLKAYDKAWSDYNKLPQKYPGLSTLYTQDFGRHMRGTAHNAVEKIRAELR